MNKYALAVLAGLISSPVLADWEECEGFVAESTRSIETETYQSANAEIYLKVQAIPKEARTSDGESCFRFDSKIFVFVPVSPDQSEKQTKALTKKAKARAVALNHKIKVWQGSRVHLGSAGSWNLKEMADNVEKEWRALID